MERDSCFGKIIDIITGNEYFIRDIPCALGRITTLDGLNIIDKKNFIGKTVEINQSNYFAQEILEISKFKLKTKLILQNCKRIYPIHLILFYDDVSNAFKLKIMGNCMLNSSPMNINDIVSVKSYDIISFDCQVCKSDHIYVVVFPHSKGNYTLQNPIGEAGVEINNHPKNQSTTCVDYKVPSRLPDTALTKKWTTHEKDCLKKFLLIYGYGRWNMIRVNSGGVLNEKNDLELKGFSNAFIKCIIDLLPPVKIELRKFLVNFVNEHQNENEPYIIPQKEDWGNLITQRAPAWGKRIQLLYRVKQIIEKFKNESKKNKQYRLLISNGNITEEEKEKLQSQINTNFDHWDNLLNFLPNSAFYGQRPSIWWTKSHDIDLLRGTYKYGYANYILMRRDSKLSFCKLDKNDSFQEFPNADTITRRLKKLIQIIIKCENNEGAISFEDNQNTKEPTGFSLEEKNKIIEYLINCGIPLNSEGKSDYSSLKEKLIEKGIISGNLSIPINIINNQCVSPANGVDQAIVNRTVTQQILEHFIQRLSMISQQIIQLKENGIVNIDDNIKEQLDPDDDGFEMSYETASQMNKSRNYLYFIRKNIISHNYKLFEQGLKNLIEITKKGNSQPEKCKEDFWVCAVHDKALISLIEERGFNYLKNDIQSNSKFQNIPMTYNDYMDRINFICEFYRDYLQGAKAKKKKDSYLNTITSNSMMSLNKYDSINHNGINGQINQGVNMMSSRKRTGKITIQRDEKGEIIYPIVINASLKILDLGKIEYERIHYHSEKNLFPIGYKAVREHQSMFKLGERALYTCEILDGGLKPQYKLISNEDPDNPIIRDSSTGCWIAVCNKINILQGSKRSKVTISGTDRFGLSDSNVVRLLQSLPNADKCSKYIMKQFDD